MKNILFSAVAFAVLPLGCRSVKPTPWQEYESLAMYLSVSYPSSCRVVESPGKEEFQLECQEAQTQTHSVVGFEWVDSESAYHLLAQRKKFSKHKIDGMSQEMAVVNGAPAIVQEGPVKQSPPAVRRAYTFLHGKRLLRVFLMAPTQAQFEKMLPDFEKMISTLKLGDQP